MYQAGIGGYGFGATPRVASPGDYGREESGDRYRILLDTRNREYSDLKTKYMQHVGGLAALIAVGAAWWIWKK